MYHIQDGKIYKIIGPGSLLPADPNDPEVKRLQRRLNEAQVLADSAEKRRRDELEARIQAEQERSRRSHENPPEWGRV